MTADFELDPPDVRLLQLAARAPGAHILAIGHGAGEWVAAARQVAVTCRVEAIEASTDIAQTLAERGVRHGFIMRHSGKNLAFVLDGLDQMLGYSRIDLILFGDFEARTELPPVAGRLASYGYRLFGIEDDGLFKEFTFWIEGLPYRRYLAIHQRVADLILFSVHRALDLAGLCQHSGVEIRGLIHLGAHEGQELTSYRKIGQFPVTLVEAHPDIFQRLVANVSDIADVFAIHAAVTDRDGPVTLHISAHDQSSSVLPIGAMQRLIPTTVEQGTIEVPGRSLDSLFNEWRSVGHEAARANVMVSDIQGAELLALSGARETLPQFDAIILEVSFDDLYAGCAQVEEIDQFMETAGFERIATVSTWHPSWSDAFYRRRP